MESRFKIGDTIFWYCDIERCTHHAKIKFVNYAGVGYPDINYEVSTICCGREQTIFVDENDAMEEDF